MLIDFIQLTIYGLVLGSILTLGAIGISLVFGVLRFGNFAHGDLMTLGAFFALPLVVGLGLPIPLAALLAAVGVALVAIAIDQTVYARMRHVNPIMLLISSFGMALIIRSAIQLIWGPHNQVYVPGIQTPYRIGDFIIKPDHLWIIGGAMVLVIALHLFLTYTKVGKAMRAMADNGDLALVSGIPARRVILWTWAIGGGLAAIAGVFLGMDTRLHPNMGWSVLLPMFAATILGGIGKPYGAILGGMVVGVSMELSTLIIPPAYKFAVAFVIMVIMLIVRPQGLIKGR